MEHLLRELKVLDKMISTCNKKELINVEDRMVYLIHRLEGEFGVPQTMIKDLLDQIEEV
jgi:hypothetical protein